MCGAVQNRKPKGLRAWGSSPRVRSGRSPVSRNCSTGGIISACAERSHAAAEIAPPVGDHLRVCGAVFLVSDFACGLRGSSPRVRSGHTVGRVRSGRIGIISACAERSPSWPATRSSSRDHLRVCGAVSCILLGFGPVGWCGMFDSYVVRGRGVALFSIFGMDAFDICYAR